MLSPSLSHTHTHTHTLSLSHTHTLSLQLPIIEIDGQVFTQYKAISRWAASLAGIYPQEPLELLKVEEVIEIYNELLYKVPFPKDEEEKKAAREEYLANKVCARALLSHTHTHTHTRVSLG